MPKIVIVGAGIAGISCARYLSDRTDFCVEIFEANKERYGGRLWSYKIPGYAGRYVELGGMWLHEGQDPCHPLRPVFQCLDVQENDAGDLTSAQCIKKDGQVFTKNDVERLGLLTKKLENLRQKIIEGERSGKDISLAQAIEKIRTDDDDSLSNDDHVLEVFISSLESYHGSTKDNISFLYCDGIPDSQKSIDLSGADLVVTNGYTKILDHLINNGRKFDIKFGREVKVIDYSDHKHHYAKIRIVCKSGDEFEADHVILAVPLSILKRKMIKFDPELPDDQNMAIERIGFDNKMKVFLLFDRVFWPAEKSAFFYESQNPAGFPIYIGNIFYINRSPALLAMISGDGVYLAEKMTKEQIVEKILQSLTKMFGGEKVANSKVVYSAVINWGEQEHIYGAYSFSQIGMKSEDAYNICKPISPLLYFAGEHTAFLEDLHGSATGAYVSGIRAAKELLSDNKHYFPTRWLLKSKL